MSNYTRSTKFRVLAEGINYPNSKGTVTRAEKDDVIDDVPPTSATWLVKDGALEVVKHVTAKHDDKEVKK